VVTRGCQRLSQQAHLERFAVVLLAVLISLEVGLLIAYFPRAVHGEVRDELDGESIPNATILANGYRTDSDQEGRYDLGWIHGTLTVTVRADGYLPTESNIPRGRFPGDTVPWCITLAPNSLSGTIGDAQTGDPLPNSAVTGGELRATADESGHYSPACLEAGEWLRLAMPSYETAPDVLTEARVGVLDLYTHRPISGALVILGSGRASTDANGVAMLRGLPKGSILSVQMSGYEAVEIVYNGDDRVSIALRPNTLRGVVRDSTDGKAVVGATVAAVSAGEVVTCCITDGGGSYMLLHVPPSLTVVASAAGYQRLEIPVTATTDMDIELEQFKVKGIYMPLGLLTNEMKVNELVDLVDRTELNAMVVDMKNDFGWLGYPSALVEAQQAGAYIPTVMDVTKLLALCRGKGIYTIARLVVFKDPKLATAYPDWAVQTADGEVWTDLEGSAWGDPFRSDVQDYNIAIAREVAMLGFDELQFDYLRFPSDGAIKQIKYSRESTLESRTTTIREFCARLRQELETYGIPLSADLFGLTVWVSTEEDMGIGQRVVDIAPYMDYLSPMLYPATFAEGNLGYEQPLLHPYEVIYRSCLELSKRVGTRVRPWLQHYSTNGVIYGAEEMRLQQKAADDAQTEGWMFWHAAGRYDAQSFEADAALGNLGVYLESSCFQGAQAAP
jgi:hypothetical protein